jgi:[ribosomal protein S5]-alanine N-acetyltransferase
MEPLVETDRVITSGRLEMPILTRDQLERIGNGEITSVAAELDVRLSAEWLEAVRWLAGMRARQLRDRPQDSAWLLRPIVRADTREAIGYLNFHAGPDDRGMVEIGYALLPAAWGQGYAIEAVRAALDWARRAYGIRQFRASVAPDNERSLNLIGKLGFVRTGEQWDPEDGLELVFELKVD